MLNAKTALEQLLKVHLTRLFLEQFQSLVKEVLLRLLLYVRQTLDDFVNHA